MNLVVRQARGKTDLSVETVAMVDWLKRSPAYKAYKLNGNPFVRNGSVRSRSGVVETASKSKSTSRTAYTGSEFVNFAAITSWQMSPRGFPGKTCVPAVQAYIVHASRSHATRFPPLSNSLVMKLGIVRSLHAWLFNFYPPSFL